jgi:hypothetical protein
VVVHRTPVIARAASSATNNRKIIVARPCITELGVPVGVIREGGGVRDHLDFVSRRPPRCQVARRGKKYPGQPAREPAPAEDRKGGLRLGVGFTILKRLYERVISGEWR